MQQGTRQARLAELLIAQSSRLEAPNEAADCNNGFFALDEPPLSYLDCFCLLCRVAAGSILRLIPAPCWVSVSSSTKSSRPVRTAAADQSTDAGQSFPSEAEYVPEKTNCTQS